MGLLREPPAVAAPLGTCYSMNFDITLWQVIDDRFLSNVFVVTLHLGHKQSHDVIRNNVSHVKRSNDQR